MAQGIMVDILISIAAAVGFGLTALYVAVARRHKPTWKAGVIMLLACAELTLAHVLQSISSDAATKVFWYKMIYFGFTITPTAFFCLALGYSGLGHVLTPRTWLVLSVFPALTAGLVFTNEIHGWIWNPANTVSIVNSQRFLTFADAGIWYWVYVAYSYFVMGLGCFFLVRLLIRLHGIYGWQASAVIVGAILAILGSALDIFRVSPLPRFSSTALGLALGSILVAYILAPLRRRDLLSVSHGTILSSLSDNLIVVDGDGRIVDMNPAAERLVGRPVSQAIGKPLEQFLPGPISIWTGNPNKNAEVTLNHEDTPHVFDLRVSTIQGWQNRVEGRVIVLRDITERKQIENELREQKLFTEQRVIERTTQLEAANRELEAFAYSVSHDLRAPLRAIDGYTRILIEDYEASLDAEGKRVCGVVQDEARRMGELIDDLLALSRLGRAEMQISKINMETLAHTVFQELTTPEDRERIDFHVSPLPSAQGDSNLIHQVWTNLLSNAIKFSSKRPRAIIQVTANQTAEEVIYAVNDNGAGFEMQYADKLFGVFQRLHSEREFPGTGVGLATAKRIIHRHDGRVWGESQGSQGATFYFSLPKKGI